jgi:NAD(P)H-flavin reductase
MGPMALTGQDGQSGIIDPMKPAVVRVQDYRRENDDTFTLALDPPTPTWSCRPGQFNMLYAFGVGEVAISVSGDPAKVGTSVVHTIRNVGSVTGVLSRALPGSSLGLRGPFGTAWPVDEVRGQDVVLVTGGIGLAPLRPALYHFLNHRGDYGRIILLHGARTPEDLIYTDQLNDWSRSSAVEVFATVDRATSPWQGAVGPVTMLFPRITLDPRRTVAFMCGPEIMMCFALLELEKRGLGHDQVFVTLERNMQCAIGLCGHCQLGPSFVCADGPVFRYDRVQKFFEIREA